MKIWLSFYACFCVAMSTLASSPASAADRTGVVVELFTSQGCSSCPAADAFLAELAKRPDVVALAFHVDYWDHLGWKDPYAQAAYSKRQRRYVAALGARYVYTPQMVVDGRFQDVGSDRRRIDLLLYQAAAARRDVPAIDLRGAELKIGASAAPIADASIWVAYFTSSRANDVASGENHGRHMATTNVVRALLPLGPYDGKAATLAIDLAAAPKDCDGVAVLIQQAGPGRIFAAHAFDLPPR